MNNEVKNKQKLQKLVWRNTSKINVTKNKVFHENRHLLRFSPFLLTTNQPPTFKPKPSPQKSSWYLQR